MIAPLTFTKETEFYGFPVPKGHSGIALELDCYRKNWGPDKGGLGAEAHFRNAFKLAWPKFIWHDWMEMLMGAFCQEKYITVIGHSRATKTYGAAHLLYLDYCADPYSTWTSLTTTSFDGLRSRMWSDVLAAVETASFPCPFKITSSSNELKLRIGDKAHLKDDKYMIEGFATAIGGAGRIQGKHAPRRRLALDEAQELPDDIWTAEVNAGTAPDFKSFRLANPTDKLSKFGALCEPVGGWTSIHDSDLYWRNAQGRLVLHFDGLQCHNYKLFEAMNRGQISGDEYKAKKLIFMLQPEYVEELRKAPGGTDSLEWWMYVRGFFPGDGVAQKIFPDLIIDRMRPDIIFDFKPTAFALLDPAYEHDECVLHFGHYRERRDGTMGIQFSHTVVVPIGMTNKEKTKDEQIADFVIKTCKEQNVLPENYIQDTTGNGRSVFSHISRDWARNINGVEFGGKPTERILITGDPKKCEDLFCYFVDELHFRAAAWAAAGQIGGIGNLSPRTIQDLGTRLYLIKKPKKRVESKEELKKRIGRSPDHGDAFILIGELMAKKGHIPGSSVVAAAKADTWANSKAAAEAVANRYSSTQEFSHF